MVLIHGPGDSAEHFHIHRTFAICRSPIFKAAFEGPYLEAQSQTYKIDGPFDDNAIRILAHWIYTMKIDFEHIKDPKTGELLELPDEPVELEGDERTPGIDTFIDALVQLWVLADRLLMPKLQNAAMKSFDKLTTSQELLPSPKTCGYVYENTSEDSPLRRYILQRWSMDSRPFGFKSHSQDLPHEMLCEMTALFMEMVVKKDEEYKLQGKGWQLKVKDFMVVEN